MGREWVKMTADSIEDARDKGERSRRHRDENQLRDAFMSQ